METPIESQVDSQIDSKLEINHSDIPIRLFKSDFLEFFSHVHPVTIVVIWAPFLVYMAYWGFTLRSSQASLVYLPVCFLVGLFIWTFAEYNIHRFIFHLEPHSPLQKRIAFLFHGVHHAQPRMKTRLVMPPAVSIPMGAIVYLLFYLILAKVFGQLAWVGPLVSGFSVGYLTYDLTHYATHHFPMRHGVFKF